MIDVSSKKFKDLDDRFYTAFKDAIPTEMIPASETIEQIETIVNESIEQGKDLFPEYYGFRNDVLY